MAEPSIPERGNGWPPYPFPVERYCIDSGRPVVNEGDRCMTHGGAPTMCTTDVRPAQCAHPYRSPNHPTPMCAECGWPIAGWDVARGTTSNTERGSE